MKLKEKKEISEKTKIILIYATAGLLVLAALIGVLIYHGVAVKSLDKTVESMELQLTLRRREAEITTALEAAELEREAEKWDGYAAQYADRLEQRRQELLILVNPWNTIPQDYYVRLEDVEYGYLMDTRAAQAFRDMLYDCRMAGFIPEVCSTYRTHDYQQMLFDNKLMRVNAEGWYAPEEAQAIAAMSVALPDTSEHQLGLAADIMHLAYPYLNEYQQYTSTQLWLMENCWSYGFVLRYHNDKSDITGIIFEPWHYRYVGLATAEELHDRDITLEEYLEDGAVTA